MILLQASIEREEKLAAVGRPRESWRALLLPRSIATTC
jgi:hypothetical protein